ncbi:uncharacterized protein PSFLO_02156 [Pseudozyma flocculosa]|uniref:Uncharacterized protein n=1 Tax=Pseudozyma flocculosa TaxID=84751 RepID=A0A5C3EY38_9BASI|nr:uncharacterized protein PSFLO_02156 [Pseudozyma flocculosa]
MHIFNSKVVELCLKDEAKNKPVLLFSSPGGLGPRLGPQEALGPMDANRITQNMHAYGDVIGLTGSAYCFQHDAGHVFGVLFSCRSAAVILNHQHGTENVTERHYLETILHLPVLKDAGTHHSAPA